MAFASLLSLFGLLSVLVVNFLTVASAAMLIGVFYAAVVAGLFIAVFLDSFAQNAGS